MKEITDHLDSYSNLCGVKKNTNINNFSTWIYKKTCL